MQDSSSSTAAPSSSAAAEKPRLKIPKVSVVCGGTTFTVAALNGRVNVKSIEDRLGLPFIEFKAELDEDEWMLLSKDADGKSDLDIFGQVSTIYVNPANLPKPATSAAAPPTASATTATTATSSSTTTSSTSEAPARKKITWSSTDNPTHSEPAEATAAQVASAEPGQVMPDKPEEIIPITPPRSTVIVPLNEDVMGKLRTFIGQMSGVIFINPKPVYFDAGELGTITLDSYAIYKGPKWYPVTRVRAPFVVASPFQCHIEESTHVFSGLFSARKKIKVEDPAFDKPLWVTASDKPKCLEFLGNTEFRNALVNITHYTSLLFGCEVMEVTDRDSAYHPWGSATTKMWKSHVLPTGVNEVALHQLTWLRDPYKIHYMIETLAFALEQLRGIGVAKHETPTFRCDGIE
ncbi:hypothetical protein Pelo_9084 [Pelomyxa schiedti]|nr:hypothetical protein Pelo_9084 [Pelomyxa schiedti]